MQPRRAPRPGREVHAKGVEQRRGLVELGVLSGDRRFDRRPALLNAPVIFLRPLPGRVEGPLDPPPHDVPSAVEERGVRDAARHAVGHAEQLDASRPRLARQGRDDLSGRGRSFRSLRRLRARRVLGPPPLRAVLLEQRLLQEPVVVDDVGVGKLSDVLERGAVALARASAAERLVQLGARQRAGGDGARGAAVLGGGSLVANLARAHSSGPGRGWGILPRLSRG